MSEPLLAARNVAARAWRRAAAVPKRIVRLTRRTRRLRQQAAMFQGEWQVERELAALARGRGPIIAGPWLSEVGFEVLYWIPFLAWFEDRYRVDRERVIAVSRGGVADWYKGVADRYVEIFDHVDPAGFALRNAARRAEYEAGGQKQTRVSQSYMYGSPSSYPHPKTKMDTLYLGIFNAFPCCVLWLFS